MAANSGFSRGRWRRARSGLGRLAVSIKVIRRSTQVQKALTVRLAEASGSGLLHELVRNREQGNVEYRDGQPDRESHERAMQMMQQHKVMIQEQ